MRRNQAVLTITDEQRDELKKWAQSSTLPAGDVFRARLVLALAGGQTYEEIKASYNQQRPHEALQDQTPASFYTPSCRPMPRRIPALVYGDDVAVRRVSQQGSFRMQGQRTFLSEIFAYEWIGLRALDERYFQLLYGPVPLGYLDSFRHVFHRLLSPALGHRLGLNH